MTTDENRTPLDDLRLFINVYDCAAALAVAKSFVDANGDEYERVRYLDDVERIGSVYSDLITAVESQGAVNISGCYNCSNKIIGAAFCNKDIIAKIWADTE